MRLPLVTLAALLAGARAGVHNDEAVSKVINKNKVSRNYDTSSLQSGCLYDGRWYASGATVTTRESCLRCVCAQSALSCSRRACAPLPDPPPKRCHVRHRRGSCCPELHCPDGVFNMELEGSARSVLDDFSDIAIPPTLGQACVEGGTVYAAGSAMSASVACEQCFCLKGARKCVRPTCLPPPPHCVPRPTPGACCPQRYYCEHDRPILENSYDCKVNGRRVQEGERVTSGNNCTACFCLKGAVRCQALGCAPPLHGCEPILRPGECCAHQYKCGHGILKKGTLLSDINTAKLNSILSTRMDNRAFSTKNMSKLLEITTKKILDEIYTVKNLPVALATNNNLITTTKVKRKTDEHSLNLNENLSNNTKSSNVTTTSTDNSAAKLITSELITELPTEETTTEQSEGTIKIIINGTINCTAELSSTSLPLSISNDTDKIQMESLPRVPIVNGIEAQTYSPNDIITDRSVDGDFDENETFTINVTSSLNAKTNSTPTPVIATVSKIPAPVNSVNSSKKTKGDYDYDYTEPTLPPSLPNLKIIPFVAADAVVDDEPTKETLTYPIIEREDKFPVYYPSDSKESSFTRREDIYHPTQYPIFMSEKEPMYTQDLSLSNNRYPVQSDLGHQYGVATSLKNHNNEAKPVTKAPLSSSTFGIGTPAVNLFSPPVETEGGFIPKGPGIIDEYYAVYPSTQSSLAVPHLTTSMQLDISKDECISDDGQHVADGESISIQCSQCICTWGRLSCAPTLCRAPVGCEYRSPSTNSEDQCCGDIICLGNVTNSILAVPVAEKTINDSAIKVTNKNETIQTSQTKKTAMENPIKTSNGTDVFKNHDKTKEKAAETSPTKLTSGIDSKLTKFNITNDSANNILTKVNITTAKPITHTNAPITTTTLDTKEVNDTSLEYDEDDDDGFSFGSVLKLLLSDSYGSSTKTPNKDPTPAKVPNVTKPPLLISTTTSRPSSVNPFKPLPPLPFIPSQNSLSNVNRIDHLILGEATAIKRTTTRPITNKTTKRPTEKVTERPDDLAFTSALRPPNLSGSSLPGIGAELLKLAGCNIYGRMYRVGRIIAELSTACQECWCTEVGVQCKPLGC